MHKNSKKNNNKQTKKHERVTNTVGKQTRMWNK